MPWLGKEGNAWNTNEGGTKLTLRVDTDLCASVEKVEIPRFRCSRVLVGISLGTCLGRL